MHEKINCSNRANKQACTKPTGARARRDPLLQGSRGGRGSRRLGRNADLQNAPDQAEAETQEFHGPAAQS